jgi:hypothetical protein
VVRLLLLRLRLFLPLTTNPIFAMRGQQRRLVPPHAVQLCPHRGSVHIMTAAVMLTLATMLVVLPVARCGWIAVLATALLRWTAATALLARYALPCRVAATAASRCLWIVILL